MATYQWLRRPTPVIYIDGDTAMRAMTATAITIRLPSPAFVSGEGSTFCAMMRKSSFAGEIDCGDAPHQRVARNRAWPRGADYWRSAINAEARRYIYFLKYAGWAKYSRSSLAAIEGSDKIDLQPPCVVSSVRQPRRAHRNSSIKPRPAGGHHFTIFEMLAANK